MAKENKPSEWIELNYLRRYPTQGIFADGTGFSKNPVIEQNEDRYNKHESITDKESYRLNLASARGAISSLTEGQQKGMYLFPDGKYSVDKDISHILRKDLSIVEIDDYIMRSKEALSQADSELSSIIESNLEKLEKKKADIVAAQSKQKTDSSSGE